MAAAAPPRRRLVLLALVLLAAAQHAAPAAAEEAVVSAADVAALRAELAELKALVGGRKQAPATAAGAAAPARRAQAVTEQIAGLAVALDCCWMLLCGALVMFMHLGFGMLETGCCRAKNASSVLMKNLVNVCVGTLGWYIFGWAFAYGGPMDDDGMLKNGGFIGSREFAGSGFLTDGDGSIGWDGAPGASKMQSWFFQWAFCTAAATIVSGGVAERVTGPAYAGFAFVMASFIYPVVVAWTWGYGWLANLFDVGFMDFAGSGVVHLTGGVAALAGTAVLGAREGRWVRPEEFVAHNLPLVVLGTFALWFGWYGFNPGSTLAMHDASTAALASQVAMNTTLSAATCGIAVFVLRFALLRRYDVGALCNGILAGLVSITAGCGNVESGSAVLIGFLGAFVYQASSMLMIKLKLDDPVDAVSVHGACGVWGVLAAGLFDWGRGFDHFHGWNGLSCMTDEAGNCRTGIGGTAFGVQIVMIIVICLWSGTLSGLTFFALKMTGKLRYSEEVERTGIDHAKHSPAKAYAMNDPVLGADSKLGSV